jgi:hypothetical protein
MNQREPSAEANAHESVSEISAELDEPWCTSVAPWVGRRSTAECGPQNHASDERGEEDTTGAGTGAGDSQDAARAEPAACFRVWSGS